MPPPPKGGPAVKRYEFHSALAPEELKKELGRWVRVENILLHKDGKLKVKWWGMRLRLSRWDFERGDFAGTWVKPFSTGASMGTYFAAYNESPFWGEVAPDGAGGSILRGFFFPPLWGILLVVPTIIGCVVFAIMGLLFSFSFYSVLCFSVLTYLLVKFAIDVRSVESRPKRNLEFLERNFQELEA